MATMISHSARSMAFRLARKHAAVSSQSSLRWLSSYPPHEIVGMPNLSPVSSKHSDFQSP